MFVGRLFGRLGLGSGRIVIGLLGLGGSLGGFAVWLGLILGWAGLGFIGLVLVSGLLTAIITAGSGR